jgi:hypothetical protein
MAASISASVTQSVSMSGAPFSSVSTLITGETSSVVEQTFASTSALGTGHGTPVAVSGIGFDDSKLALLYLLSDSADVDVIFTGTTGTHTITCNAGVAQIFNIAGGATNPLASNTGTTTMTVTNNGTQAVSTDFHARMVYVA